MSDETYVLKLRNCIIQIRLPKQLRNDTEVIIVEAVWTGYPQLNERKIERWLNETIAPIAKSADAEISIRNLPGWRYNCQPGEVFTKHYLPA